MPSTPLSEDDIKIMLVSGENWGVGQSSIVKRFVMNQFGEENDSNLVSKHVTKSYSKEFVLKVAQQTDRIQHEEKKENELSSTPVYYTINSANHSNSGGLSYLTNQDLTNASPSTHSLLSNLSSNSNSSESLLFHPRNIILQIEDYIPSYITDLETTDERLSTSEIHRDEQYYLEFKRNQQDHYYEKDAFLICFDGKSEDFLNYIYNEIETIRNACDEFTEYKVIVLVLTKQDKEVEQSQLNLQQREEMIEKLLDETKLELFRVSAKDNINIQELFNKVSEKALAMKDKKSKLKAKLKKKIKSHIHNKQYQEQKHKCLIQ